MATLNELMEKRAAARIAKYNPDIMTKPIKDLTVMDLEKVGLGIMSEYYKAQVAPSGVYIPADALRIIGLWAAEKKVLITQ